MISGTTRMGQRQQKIDCFAWLYDMTKTTTEPVCMYFVLPIRMTWSRSWIHLFACIFMFAKSTSIKDEDLEGNDKIRPQYVQQKDTKDTIGRYIVLLPEEKSGSRQREREWWRVLGACTYIVIDDGVTSIGNAFKSSSARIGEITFLRTCPLYNWRLTYTLTTTKGDRIGLSSI